MISSGVTGCDDSDGNDGIDGTATTVGTVATGRMVLGNKFADPVVVIASSPPSLVCGCCSGWPTLPSSSP